MKNVDVPLWDKGDDTDDFSKGGASAMPSMPMRQPSTTKSPLITKIYKQILGREPTSREMAYYKYSSAKKEDILEKLITSDEHKDILEKAKEYPDLKDSNKKLKSTVLKLKSNAQDRASEHTELQRLLDEKNTIINTLRQEKNAPYLDEDKILQKDNSYYNVSRNAQLKKSPSENFWDRLSYVLFGDK